jgi:FAD/FMN-containing dehydrogenase
MTGMQQLQKTTIADFKAHFRGIVVLPEDADYDKVRQIWNAMINRRPALIARCVSPEDVSAAVVFAREHNLLISVRGGGHNIAGNAVCDNGLMIDLSLMKNIRVDPNTRKATVEPGCILAEFDTVAQKYGLATPLGINSTTGVAGLTLGGGFGWLSRKYGMTIDNLLSADVVTADGNQVHASLSENTDLFWGLRGGGGNFGVVTKFEFMLHPVGPDLLSGLIVFPSEQATQVITKFARFTETMPDDLTVWMVIRNAPPLPFLPQNVRGKKVVVLALCYAGDPSQGMKLIEPLHGFGTAYGDHIGVQPYVDWQQVFDPLLTRGARNYWKTHNFSKLSDEAIDIMIEYAGIMPSPLCEIFIGAIGGQTARVESTAMAYPSRDANYVMNVHCRWMTPSEDDRCITWARELFISARPYAGSGAYVNFLTQDETDRIALVYGANYNRLVELKKRYDPKNIFRMNQNIRPG